MNITTLPLTADPRQILTLSPVIDGESLRARIEVRYLTGPGCWVLSLWNDASGELMVNQIPLIASVGWPNDLFAPYRYKRDGKGLGTLLCIPTVDEPSSQDPGQNNLSEFSVMWCDTYGQ